MPPDIGRIPTPPGFPRLALTDTRASEGDALVLPPPHLQGLRPDGTAQVLGGINGQSIARRLTAAASAAGIEGRITGHSGRVGLAVELTRRGAPEQATAKAGGWKSSRMVAHYAAAVAAEQGAVATYL